MSEDGLKLERGEPLYWFEETVLRSSVSEEYPWCSKNCSVFTVVGSSDEVKERNKEAGTYHTMEQCTLCLCSLILSYRDTGLFAKHK